MKYHFKGNKKTKQKKTIKFANRALIILSCRSGNLFIKFRSGSIIQVIFSKINQYLIKKNNVYTHILKKRKIKLSAIIRGYLRVGYGSGFFFYGRILVFF